MTWAILPFGRHKGRSLPQVLFVDPDWFFWAHDGGVLREELGDQGTVLYRRATHIRLRPEAPGFLGVEYVVEPRIGKLTDVRLVPTPVLSAPGSSQVVRSDWLDLSVARRIAPYDKFGGRLLTATVKRMYFGSPEVRMTRQRCELFFDQPEHFVMA